MEMFVRDPVSDLEGGAVMFIRFFLMRKDLYPSDADVEVSSENCPCS